MDIRVLSEHLDKGRKSLTTDRVRERLEKICETNSAIAAKSVAHTQKAWLVVRSFTELMNCDLTLSVVVGGPKDLMD